MSNDRLKSFIERIERIEETLNETKEDRAQIYLEARGQGFDTKVLRKVIALRKQDVSERERIEAEIELYMNSLA